MKPNITHLWEFGSPVWVLNQGQKINQKMLPKSQRQAYVGHDDGSNSVKYYHPESCKILTSRNFHFLNISNSKPALQENIEIFSPSDDALHEGGRSVGIDNTDMQGHGSILKNTHKRKRADEELVEPRKMRGNQVNYKKLHDLFSDEEDCNAPRVLRADVA